ncbi:MAG TPA: hypothetical protein VHF45_04320, partial [Thermoleophilaceae bacterium]|nr:hypothetical protein [Thermoleophilaceae bacterium]
MPSPGRHKLLHAAIAACLAGVLAGAPVAGAQAPPSSGGAAFVPPPPPPKEAKLVNGRVIAPATAPTRVKRVIAAAN